jgi:RimJ/RimL family protein N-acetyltransferase
MSIALNIRLQFYAPEYLEELNNFRLPTEQLRFTALPINVLESAEGRHHPTVILDDEVPVGFFILHSSSRVQEYTDNPNAILLTAFSINYNKQGKGFAKRGLSLLKEFTNEQFPSCDEIVLAVNQLNIPAQKLYGQVGFMDTGRRKMGEIGEQMIMSLSL